MPPPRIQFLRTIALLALLSAGVIHLLLAPEHYGHSQMHGLFFVIAGLLEIAWAVLYWRRPSLTLNTAGLALAGGLLVLWGLTRVTAPPFESTPAPVEFSGVLCKLCELAGFSAILALAVQAGAAGNPAIPASRVAGTAVLLAVLSGLLVYGTGAAMYRLIPSLSTGEHGPEAGHEHAGEEMDHGHPGGSEAEPAQEAQALDLDSGFQISNPWARAGSAGGNSAVYFKLNNPTPNQDRLVGVASPLASSAEMHLSEVDARGVATMRRQESVEIPAGWQVTFEPGGLHIMLVGLLEDLKPGEVFSLTLMFENAGSVDVQVAVQAP